MRIQEMNSSSPLIGAYVPKGWKEGALLYLQRAQKLTGRSLNMRDTELRQRLFTYTTKVGEIAVRKGIYVFPFIMLEGITLDQNIEIRDSFKPEGSANTRVDNGFRVNYDKANSIRPEFSVVANEACDESDISFSIKGAVMTKRGRFDSMVQGLNQYYDGKDWELDYYRDYTEGHKTQVDDIRNLTKDKCTADPQAAFAIDGLRLAIRSIGSKEVPYAPFGGLHVRVPINISAVEDGRTHYDIDYSPVPCIGQNNDDLAQPELDYDGGYADPVTGYVIVDNMKELILR